MLKFMNKYCGYKFDNSVVRFVIKHPNTRDEWPRTTSGKPVDIVMAIPVLVK